MFGRKSQSDAQARLDALGRSQAMIEFNLDGTIITANKMFLDVLGYRLDEIQGKHHSMFVPADQRDTAEYKAFWAALNCGEYQAREFKRIGKGGREVWILASYNPLLDENGKPYGVVKFATDVTAEKLKNADLAGQIAAIDKAQAVIEFNMDGTIIAANSNFLGALGCSLAEIKGRHHSMFVEPSERDGAASAPHGANGNAHANALHHPYLKNRLAFMRPVFRIDGMVRSSEASSIIANRLHCKIDANVDVY